jgi:quinol-cytochrome oxidoreductase complex cytochrome b subunit
LKKSDNIFWRIKKSIYNGTINPKSEPEKIALALRSLILHLHPTKINDKVIKFNHTFGLGGMAALLITIQFITGLLLRFIYEPFPGRAYESIIHLQNNILFGQLIRNMHHWSGMLLIIIVFLHLLRTYFTGAFHGKRQFNWVLGVVLLFLVLFSNFTGYLLPWDQLSYWAITVSTNMLEYIPLIGLGIKEIILGGNEVGSPTIIIFYNLHTGIFPILIIILMVFHFWRVRKAGGVVVPADEKEKNLVPTIPNLVAKEFIAALILIASILLFSVILNAPLLDIANPDFSPNPAKAPWYFMGIQELMLHFHPLFGAIIIPATVLSFLFLIPYFIYDSKETGLWFYSKKGTGLAIISVASSAILTIVLIILNEYIINLSEWLNFFPDVISNGLIPFVLLVLVLYGYYKYLIHKKTANKNEAFQTLFIFILTAFIILTITGIFFRGEGMALGI